MNDTDYDYRVRMVVGTDSCRHKYRVVLAANTWKVKKLCLLQTAMYWSEMTFKNACISMVIAQMKRGMIKMNISS